MLLTSMRKRALVSQGVGFKKKQKDAGESSWEKKIKSNQITPMELGMKLGICLRNKLKA
jgi:hypothetical protein